MLTYFLIGAAVGILTGVPIGPVNVAVIDAAYRHNLLRAIATGFGGCVGDGLYASVGIMGVGPLLKANPDIPPILFAISGVVLLIYGALTIRSQPVKQKASGESKENEKTDSHHMFAGFILGVALIVLNPAAIITWVVIVGSYMVGVSQMEGISAIVGIMCGSFAWFIFVAFLADHGKKLLGDKAIWITRIVGILLVGYGLYSLGRAGYYLFTEVW